MTSGFQAESDPAIAFNKQGTMYYSGIAFDRTSNGGATDGTLFLYSTTNLGATNQTAIVSSGSSSIFNDKPYLAVDTTNSTFSGHVYVSWTRFTSTRHGSTASILFSTSTNGGGTLSAPITLSDTLNVQGSIPAVGPGGIVYVAWFDAASNNIKIVKSTNGGVSFTTPTVAASIVPLPATLPTSSFRTNSFPTLTVDQQSGNIYIAWDNYRNGNADILLTRSTNSGTSFTTPVKINDDNTTNDQFYPWIASVPGRVSAIWYDRRLDPNNHNMDIFYADSTDGGATFSPNTRITNISSDPNVQFSGQFIGDYIGLAITTTEAHPVWTDTRNLNQDIFTSTVGIGPVHDIAVTAVNAPRRISYTTIKANPLNITVSISNNGNVPENVTVQISLQNSSVQENQTVAIQPGTALQVRFNLTTATVAKGNYTLVANALLVPGEINTGNGMMLGGTLQVRFPGDVNGDRRVNILDVAIVAFDFGRNCQTPGYSYAADLNNDCRIDILDIALVAFYFGTVDP